MIRELFANLNIHPHIGGSNEGEGYEVRARDMAGSAEETAGEHEGQTNCQEGADAAALITQPLPAFTICRAGGANTFMEAIK